MSYSKEVVITDVDAAFMDMALWEVDGAGKEVGTYEKVRAALVKVIRDYDISLEDVHDKLAEATKRVRDEYLYEATGGAYLFEVVDFGIDAYEEYEDSIEWYKAQKEAEYATRSSDVEWSHAVTDYIINKMDPRGQGFATTPMKFKGKETVYTDKGSYTKIPAHKSVVQSLYWLTGPKGKQGFISDPRLTKEDREVLWDFVNASWEARG